MTKSKDRVKKAYADAGYEAPEKVKKQTVRDKKADFIKRQLAEAFSTPAGTVALAYISQVLCGWRQGDAVPKNQFGAVDTDSIVYNATRRGVYTELSMLLPREVLKQAEFYNLKQEGIEND